MNTLPRWKRWAVWVVTYAIAFACNVALRDWADGRQRDSAWWFMLTWTPYIVAAVVSAAVVERLEDARQGGALIPPPDVTYVPPTFDD